MDIKTAHRIVGIFEIVDARRLEGYALIRGLISDAKSVIADGDDLVDLRTFCELLNLHINYLTSKTRDRSACIPRSIYYTYLSNRGYTMAYIGSLFGRDASSVSMAIKGFKALKKYNKEMLLPYKDVILKLGL